MADNSDLAARKGCNNLSTMDRFILILSEVLCWLHCKPYTSFTYMTNTSKSWYFAKRQLYIFRRSNSVTFIFAFLTNGDKIFKGNKLLLISFKN